MDIVLPIVFSVLIAAFMAAQLWVPRTTVPNGHVGLERVGRGDAIVQQGEPGVQPRLLPVGTYWTLRRSIDTYQLVVIPDGCIGVVTSHIGIPSESLTAPYSPRFGVFTDVEAFLAAGGRQGVQEAVLPPGNYAIHPLAFEVIVIDNSDEAYTVYGQQSAATDQMSTAEPSVVSTPNGALVTIYPDCDDDHATLAMLQVGAPDRSSYLIARFLASPAATVTIEWEFGYVADSPTSKEAVMSALATLAREEFDTFACWSVAEFVAKIQAIEAKAFAGYVARITEAVMLPKLAMPTE